MEQKNTGPSRHNAKARSQRKSDATKIEPGMNVEATILTR